MQTLLPDPTWIVGKHALMSLHAKQRNGRTEIDPLCWRIPYQWQGTHYQDNDDQPFLLLMNSGGGFVEGDMAILSGTLDPGTRTLITTTAASKFYKCEGGATSREIVDLKVGDGALLEYYPDESIPFGRSRVERRIAIDIAPTARLFATDMIAAGRIHFAGGEAFAFDSLESEFLISVDGTPVVTDRLIAEGPEEVGALRQMWSGATIMATVVVHAPDLPDGMAAEIEADLADSGLISQGASRVGDTVVCRLLAAEAWVCQAAVQRIWAIARPTLADKPARAILKC